MKTTLVRELLEVAGLMLGGELDDETAAKRLDAVVRMLCERLGADGDTEVAPEPKAPQGPTSQEIRAIFDYWVRVTGRQGLGCLLTAKRRKTIAARLKEKPAEAIRHVIRWASTNPFHQGENDRGMRYDTIEALLRSAERLESNLERSGWVLPSPSPAAREAMKIQRLEMESDEALKGGRIDEYNELQRRLAQCR